MNIENNPAGLSFDKPMSEADAVNLLSGITDPSQGQVDNDSDAEEELTTESVEEEVIDESEEAEEEAQEDEGDSGEESEIELDSSEYDNLVNLRGFLTEHDMTVDQLKSGVLMQGDYTRKTQALSKERKEFEGARDTQLQQTAELLEIAQAMVYGQQPKYSSQDLQKLKESDPRAYEDALESRVIYDQRKAEIDGIARKVTEQHQQAAQAKQQEYVQEQAQLLTQLIPEFADEAKAAEKVSAMTEYFESIGGSAEQLSQVTDAIALKVLHDATFGAKATSEAGKAKQSQKKASRRVIRKGVSATAAQKRQAAKAKRAKEYLSGDGTLSIASAAAMLNDMK